MTRHDRPFCQINLITILMISVICRSLYPALHAEAAEISSHSRSAPFENLQKRREGDTPRPDASNSDPETLETEMPRKTGNSENTEQGEAAGKPDRKEYGRMADDFQEIISKKLRSSANWLDSFFRDERAEIEENETTLKLRFSSFIEEGEGMDFNTRARLRLVLPELEDKFHIEIVGEGDPDRDTGKQYESLTERQGEIDNESDKNLNLALRYFIKTAREKNFSFNVGARLNDLTPVIYGGPRYSASKDFDPWLLRFTQEVKWFTDEGWESKTRLDYERSLGEDLFFRTSTAGYWYQGEDGYFYNINLYLYQILDEDRALEYSWNNFFQTRPIHELSEILLHIEYRRRFWRRWLFFEVRPQIAFREEDDYSPTVGITFALEAVFGKRD